jgi:hypothetical protein
VDIVMEVAMTIAVGGGSRRRHLFGGNSWFCLGEPTAGRTITREHGAVSGFAVGESRRGYTSC